MKKMVQGNLFFFLIGFVVATLTTVSAFSYATSDVTYVTSYNSRANASNVDEALNELYSYAGIKYFIHTPYDWGNYKLYGTVDELRASGSQYDSDVFLGGNLQWEDKDGDNAYDLTWLNYVCVQLNNKVGCFESWVNSIEFNKMKAFFGSENCQEVAGQSISCHANNGLSCSIYYAVDVETVTCGGNFYNCTVDSESSSCVGGGV